MKFLSNQKTGALYALSSGFCYSLLGYFGISIIQDGSSISNMLFWRFLVSALFALILLTPTVFKDSILVTDLMRVYQYGFGN